MLKLYNSKTKQKEEFRPINPKKVKIYTCGVTVYDRPHIGNARTYISCDILYRTLMEIYGKNNVIYVQNITDVDDKINKKAVERKISIQKLTKEITEYLHKDMRYLNILPPVYEPKATEHIKEMISIIERLIENGHAYVSEGHVLFDVRSMDFVLWKPALKTDDPSSIFDSPWSKGRPGWHIECSAMSHKYLGENFDIHCGGNDLKFPHHENEIAQSCCAFKGSEFAKYWFHTGFLTVNGEKMSKSLGNFTTVKELQEKNLKGSVIRFAFLKNHYRKPFDFSMQALKEAQKNLKNLHNTIVSISKEDVSKIKLPVKILEALKDDLNTSKVIAELNNLKDSPKELKKTLEFLGVFDKSFFEANTKDLKNLDITEIDIEKKIEERLEAKKNKDWKKADEIRDYLLNNGIELKDNSNGTEWSVVK
jgi:cysteinyl-tRNA synthetase